MKLACITASHMLKDPSDFSGTPVRRVQRCEMAIFRMGIDDLVTLEARGKAGECRGRLGRAKEGLGRAVEGRGRAGEGRERTGEGQRGPGS